MSSLHHDSSDQAQSTGRNSPEVVVPGAIDQQPISGDIQPAIDYIYDEKADLGTAEDNDQQEPASSQSVLDQNVEYRVRVDIQESSPASSQSIPPSQGYKQSDDSDGFEEETTIPVQEHGNADEESREGEMDDEGAASDDGSGSDV